MQFLVGIDDVVCTLGFSYKFGAHLDLFGKV